MSTSMESKESTYARSLIEASLDPLVTISPKGRITDVNEATVKITGVIRKKIIGDDFSNYFTEPEKARRGYKEVLKKGAVKDYPLKIRHKSGKTIPVLYNASVYRDAKGKVLGVFAAARDISELQVMMNKAGVLEGAKELLIEWGYALDELAFGSREGLTTFREIESDAANHWFGKTVGSLPKVKTAYEATITYRDIADERRIIQKKNFKLEEKRDTVLGTFLSHDCPYRECCAERNKVGGLYVCFRATPFVTAIKLMTGKEYKSEVFYEQTQPGRVCIIRGVPTELAFKVGLSYKLGRGTVKLNEIDCEKLGIDLIDNVTVRPSREEIADRKLTAMSYSQTKYPSRMILMSIVDARSLGLLEKDTVYITKAGKEDIVNLVSADEYEAKPGEYEIPGLNEPEEEAEEESMEPAVREPDESMENAVEETGEFEGESKEKPVAEPGKPKKDADESDRKKKHMRDFEAKIDSIRDK